MVEGFFWKIWHGSRVSPPPAIEAKFIERFPDTRNVEWFMSAEGYEVIFYEDEVEHIATYSREGQLHTLLINLSPDALPDPVRRYALSRGEIMNAISMKEGDRVSYELIVRDGALERYALLFDAGGTLLKEEHL